MVLVGKLIQYLSATENQRNYREENLFSWNLVQNNYKIEYMRVQYLNLNGNMSLISNSN